MESEVRVADDAGSPDVTSERTKDCPAESDHSKSSSAKCNGVEDDATATDNLNAHGKHQNGTPPAEEDQNGDVEAMELDKSSEEEAPAENHGTNAEGEGEYFCEILEQAVGCGS